MAKKKVAVILAGAVARGAFEAGVLKELAKQDLEVTRLVAASAGALNAVLYASYVRRGIERDRADDLAKMWIEDAGPRTVFCFSPLGLLRRQGMFSARRVRRLLRSRLEIDPGDQTAEAAAPRPVSLRIVVAPLRGLSSRVLDQRAHKEDPDPEPRPLPRERTTYEHVVDFDQGDFGDEARRDHMIEAALASSAFPFVFTPIEVHDARVEGGVGPCIDGGAVNNAPIKWAVGGKVGDELDAIIVVSPNPEIHQCPPDIRGGRLMNQTVTALINERLCRDLREAERVNEQLRNLKALKGAGLDGGQLQKVLEALGWSNMKEVGLVQIRPAEALGGNLFSAFFSRTRRTEYVARGEDCARKAFEDPQNRQILFDEPPAGPAAHGATRPSEGASPGPQ